MIKISMMHINSTGVFASDYLILTFSSYWFDWKKNIILDGFYHQKNVI